MAAGLSLQQAIRQRRSCRRFSDQAIESGALRRLLWAGQGLTDDSSNRTTPSAHSLHPLRLLVAAGNVTTCDTGLHELDTSSGDLVPVHNDDVRSELEQCAIDDQPWIRNAACIITICADFVAPACEFADQPPYGGRGSRYVYIESGAVAQNIALQAIEEALGCVVVAGFRDEATAAALGLEAPYKPVLHLCLGVPSAQ